jgi:hypothetical protein
VGFVLRLLNKNLTHVWPMHLEGFARAMSSKDRRQLEKKQLTLESLHSMRHLEILTYKIPRITKNLFS